MATLPIETVDEAIIDGDVATVRSAILDEVQCRSHWWAPSMELHPCGRIPADRVGGLIDMTVHHGAAVRFRCRVAAISETELRVEYVGGAFRGDGAWRFEPAAGKTRVTFRWRARPAGPLGWLAPRGLLAWIARSHHDVMQAGFAGLNAYLIGGRRA